MAKKKIKNKPKWKPKKFVTEVTIDIKTGKVIKGRYITAKILEEEKQMERVFAERWIEPLKMLKMNGL